MAGARETQFPQRTPIRARVDHAVIIIGAGFSGINAAIELKARGIQDFVLLERAADVGGTWRDNVYPGCACDVPSYLYSYSFAPNINWSMTYSGSAEIQSYIRCCVDRYGLTDRLRFGVGIVRADFDVVGGFWRLTDAAGRVHTARAVISAIGGLVEPLMPAFAGMNEFTGDIMHTARWNQDVVLFGKKVVVIGTGASAIQIIPSIAVQVADLTVLQRTAPYVLPKLDRAIPSGVKQWFRRLPWLHTLTRRLILGLTEGVIGPAVILNGFMAKLMTRYALSHMRRVISDPALREVMTPDYQVGCKRVLFSSAFYPAITQDHVHIETVGLERLTPGGIRLADGREIDADVIVMATGFKVNIAKSPFPIVGEDGLSLEQRWSAPGGKAYKGVACAGVPNWFFMLGPNTGPGHTSILIYTEAQASYIADAVGVLLNQNLTALSVKPEVMSRYHHKLQRRMRRTSWTSGCKSWYLDEHGENHTLFPGLASEYAWSMRRFKPKEYDLRA
ncbi:MAG: NAD(P)/FAD-dependent oxidoreductase [Salinisphaera sp.]|jgi:cation diffusion facilitator CzcD-associated flavoprotein CzcO|nr:NAD(P)/FAD-dependent oxidoreductase [Salinisphaera sp.]